MPDNGRGATFLGVGNRGRGEPRGTVVNVVVMAAIGILLANPAAGTGQISLRVIADPPGPDAENLNGEVVTITNRMTVPLHLSGWTLCDALAACFRFADQVMVGPSASIRVRAGSGQDTLLDVYMGRSQPIWDNWADIATLRDQEGVIRSRCVWDRGRGVDCLAG